MPEPEPRSVLDCTGIDHRSSAGEKILRYVELLVRWNRRVNLVSSTRTEILKPLVQESIWAAGRYRPEFRFHLDIGSGAGFPAVLLAAMHPDVEVTMLESREKKAAFLQTVIHELKLKNARVTNERLEHALHRVAVPAPWDCISWKAVIVCPRDFKKLLEITDNEIRFWIFHARQLPVGDPALPEELLELARREECPCHAGWFLSEFRRRSVSRETG